MSAESVKTEVAPVEQVEQKESNAERNFAKLRQKAEKAEQLVEHERLERLKLQEEVERLRNQRAPEVPDDEEDDTSGDPYVDKRKLKKLFTKWEQKNDEKIVKTAREIAKEILSEERQRDYMFRLKSEHRDFEDVVNDESIERLKSASPKMAAMLANVPGEYEKHLFAYEAIKMANLHRKPEENVKQKVEQNLRNPYYHPATTGSGSTSMGDFSQAGKKAAYEKIQQLKAQRRG